MRRTLVRETLLPSRIGFILGGLWMVANATAQTLPSLPGDEGLGAIVFAVGGVIHDYVDFVRGAELDL